MHQSILCSRFGLKTLDDHIVNCTWYMYDMDYDLLGLPSPVKSSDELIVLLQGPGEPVPAYYMPAVLEV